MSEVPFDIEINGFKETLFIETDPAWGKMKELISSSQSTNAQGQKDIDMGTFMDKFLQLVVIRSTGTFDPKNLVMMQSMPTSVMTKIIGGVVSLVPLATYLDNMGAIEQLRNLHPQTQ